MKRKNLLPDAYGVPLVLASARAARDAGCRVIVSTDDAEVESLAHIDGHLICPRGDDLANVPVDRVVADATRAIAHDGAVLLVQPTVQPMTADLLRWFLNRVESGDYHISNPKQRPAPVALGVEDRHLVWGQAVLSDGSIFPPKLFAERSERQAMLKPPIHQFCPDLSAYPGWC